MRTTQIVLGLILGFVAVCHLKVANAASHALFVPFEYSEDSSQLNELLRTKRQFARRGQKPFGGFDQNAAVNTQANNQVGPWGSKQNSGASSIGSNIARDGSSGQVSSANVNQQSSQNAGGRQSSNNAQSQSLNFGPNGQQATNTNAGTNFVQNGKNQRLTSSSGSQSTNNNKFGSSSNIANTNTNVFREGNTRGSSADSSSQSIFQGNNGQNAGAFTNSQTSSVMGPGFVSNSASSSSQANSQNGGNAVANSGANVGAQGSNAVTNSNVGGRPAKRRG